MEDGWKNKEVERKVWRGAERNKEQDKQSTRRSHLLHENCFDSFISFPHVTVYHVNNDKTFYIQSNALCLRNKKEKTGSHVMTRF